MRPFFVKYVAFFIILLIFLSHFDYYSKKTYYLCRINNDKH